MTLANRVFNFSPGPGVLPVPVLEEIQRDMLCLPGAGASILEVSHRGKAFLAIMEETKANLKKLMAIPDNYRILFLQGGARLQFSMVPMNLLRNTGRTADYILTGSWGKYAKKEADREGKIRVVWDGKGTNYDRLPAEKLDIDQTSAYVHTTSNETIEGVQFLKELEVGNVPLVSDQSSDFLCRPVPVNKYGLIYACAQKNAGPAGITVVIIREDLLKFSDPNLPGYMNYLEHANNDSMWNTPNTFGIYVLGLVVKWLMNDIGGLAQIEQRNRDKSKLLYDVIDGSNGFYRGHAQVASRSLMNVTFRLPSDELQEKFLAECKLRKLDSLAGHRSVGGIRASIYNAMPVAGVEALRDCMKDFLAKNS